MNKIIYILLLASLSLLVACKNDVKDNTTIHTTGTNNNITHSNTTSPSNTKFVSNNKNVSTTTPSSNGERRVIKAERIITDEDKAKMAKDAEDRKRKKIEAQRSSQTEKIKAERERIKKEGEPKMIDMGNGVKIGKTYAFASYDLPSSCDLISPEFLAKVFGASADVIKVKDASSPRTLYARSCFFKWDVDAVANGGIMLQVQGNPVPKETSAFVSEFMSNKRIEGETSMDTNERTTYKDLKGIGVDAIYNHNLNRSYWNLDNKYLFMLAFNLGLSEADQRAASAKIGVEVLKNFKRLNKIK